MYQSIIHTIYHFLQVVLVMWNILKKNAPDFVSFLSSFEMRNWSSWSSISCDIYSLQSSCSSCSWNGPPVPACFHDCPQDWGPLEILRNYVPSLLLSRRSRHAGYQLSATNQRNCLELVRNTGRAHSSEIRKWWVGFLCTHLPTPLFFASNLTSLMTYGFLRWGELNKVLVLSCSDRNTIFIIEIFKRH